MKTLLTRDEFREGVFSRDNNTCVICGNEAQDAHHIIERRLFNDGGYYLDNGSSLCGECHLKAESTEISCKEIREACGIENAVLPEHLYHDNEYDKWGNMILPNGHRVKGELFFEENVQKVIKPFLNSFTDYIKYPRTYHLPFSPNKQNDDRTLPDCSQFHGKEVVVLEKMDGENTSIYNNYVHARSLENEYHPSRAWVRKFASRICWEIPDGWRICGENMFAKHAIHYHDLESYFYLFSIWTSRNFCLSWDETVEYAEILNISIVPTLWRGIWDDEKMKEIGENLNPETQEGFVVRTVDGYDYGAFKNSVAKYVRANHVPGDAGFWKTQEIVKNEIKEEI